MNNKKMALIAVVATSLSGIGVAQAATATGSLGVSMTVEDECSVTDGSLSFSSTGYLDEDVDLTGSVTIQCTNGTSYTISMGAGDSTDGTVAQRYLSDSSDNEIAYNIYTDSDMTTVWGDGTNDTSTVTGTGDGTSTDIAVYAQVPAVSSAPAVGDYDDSVTVTVTY